LKNTLAYVRHETYYFSSQTDGEIKIANKSLENLLRILVGEQTGSWNLKLATAEFA